MEERRAARIGTVSGLALLAGGTALAAVTGGAHSFFATVMLGMLALGMAHALLDEIRRQARRRSAPGWARHDTVNTVLLGVWSAGTLVATLLAATPVAIRVLGLTLSLGYALSCMYFVVERRRTITGSGPFSRAVPPAGRRGVDPTRCKESPPTPGRPPADAGTVADGSEAPRR